MAFRQSIDNARAERVGSHGVEAAALNDALARSAAALDWIRARHADGTLPLLRLPERRDDLDGIRATGARLAAGASDIVMLGTAQVIDRAPYGGSLEGLLRLLRENRSRGLAIASLPEYDRNHWANLDSLVAAGIAGFEIVNASPKANDFSTVRRDRVVALARKHNLLLLAVTDSHGWGATVLAWNLVRLPGSPPAGAASCTALVNLLRSSGTSAVQIAERHHLTREAWWPWILTPVGVVWESWRSSSVLQVVSWLIWIWLVGIVGPYRRA